MSGEDYSGFAYAHMPYEPPPAPAWEKYRSMGFYPRWYSDMLLGSPAPKPDAWECRRGCGMLVWDPEAHIETTCPEWAPRVGDE